MLQNETALSLEMMAAAARTAATALDQYAEANAAASMRARIARWRGPPHPFPAP